MTNFEKIITHGGEFHADEVSAIALLRILGVKAPVERVFAVSEEDMKNPDVLVIDIGGEFDGESNFDHHQNSLLKASNMLILNWAKDKEMIEKLEAEKLSAMLFQRVSDVDKGDSKSLSYEYSYLIKGHKTFKKALEFAVAVISNMLEDIRKSIVDEQRFYALEKVGKVRIQRTHGAEVMIGWKEHAEKEGTNFLLSPNVRGGYSLISRDSEVCNVEEDSRQTFRHNSGFIAVYATFEDAFDHALQMGMPNVQAYTAEQLGIDD